MKLFNKKFISIFIILFMVLLSVPAHAADEPVPADNAVSESLESDTSQQQADEIVNENEGSEDAHEDRFYLSINVEKILYHLYIITFLMLSIIFISNYKKNNLIADKEEDKKNPEENDNASYMILYNEVEKLKKNISELEARFQGISVVESVDEKKEDVEEVKDLPSKYNLYLNNDDLDNKRVLVSFKKGNFCIKNLYVTDTESEVIEVKNSFPKIGKSIMKENHLNIFYEEIEFSGESNSSYTFKVIEEPTLKKENDRYVLDKKGKISVDY